ncbi:MAG: UbiA family prenyltransferase, partial [Flavobacteriales bacterium]|nr:UbiA family prenyltransferase [Flavobacteriales bacterium]
MNSPRSISVTHPLSKLKVVAELFKLRLATLVVVSAVFGYLTGSHDVSFTQILVLCIGGALLTGGSNGLNQVIEREADRLMSRTANRPLPTARLTMTEGILWSVLAAVTGIFLLWYFLNTASGVLGLMA